MIPNLKLTPKDLKELEEFKRRNFKERLEFISMRAKWMKEHPKTWSKSANRIVDWQID